MEERDSSFYSKNKTRKVGLNHGGSFLKEAYAYFVSTKNNDISKSIDKRTFSLIMKDLYKKMANAILDGRELALPCSMGNIVVNKRISDRRSIFNYRAMIEEGKKVFEHNIHTNGYRFSIQWIKGYPTAGIQNGYQFKSSRMVSRDLAGRLKAGNGYRYQSISKKKIERHEI